MNWSLRGAFLPLLALLAIGFCAAVTRAQDADVKKYTVDVRLEPGAHSATIRTTISVWNPTSAPRRQVQLRVNANATITAVTAGGQTATFDAKPDKRYPALSVITVQLPAAVPGPGAIDLVIDERLVLKTGGFDASISPGETVLLPSSLWVPFVNSPFIQYGPNTSPVVLTAASAGGERVLSGGVMQGTTFNQPLFDLPFVVSGAFDQPVTKSAAGVAFEVWLPANSPAAARAGAERLLGDAEKIAGYYTRVLGAAPQSTFRIIATDRGAGFAGPSAVTLGRRVFLRDASDAETFELLADAIARIWIDGGAAVRGATPGSAANRPSGVAIVGAALPRYLAIAAIGDQFGAQAEASAFARMRTALVRMGDLAAQVQLALATPSDPAFFGLMSTKGPLALRVVEHEIGRDALLSGVKAALASGRSSGSLTFDDVKAAITKTSGKDLTSLYTNWFDKVIQPDLIVGLPQQTSGSWTSALRNLGTGDIVVDVVATTASGKKIAARATVLSEGFGEARFETTESVTRVEVDPDHIIPQKDYGNDARPPHPAADALFAAGVDLLKKKDYPAAEAKLREAVAADPTDAVSLAWLARALAAQNKSADAARAANAAVAMVPVPLEAASWGNNVLGQLALGEGKAQEAIERFRRASAFAVESSALKTAREGIAAAEKAAGQPAVADASITKFFTDFDRAVSAGVSTVQAEQYVDSAALPDFVKGLVTSVARKWATEVVHAESTSNDDVLVDARFTTSSANQLPNTATAMVRLRREGASWKIAEVQILETTDNR